MPPEENDWSRDKIGFLDYESSMDLTFSSDIFTMDLIFYSQPTNYAGNKHLGIDKSETFWKCYLANVDAPDPSNPYEAEISLSTSTTDKPRRINTKYIEAAAQNIL